MKSSAWFLGVVLVLAVVGVVGCGDEEGGEAANNANSTGGFEETLDIALCDPARGGFTSDITNPFFPMPVGKKLVLVGEEDGEEIRVEITALDEEEEVAGVMTRIIEEHEEEGGEVVEISRNFFAQASDGTLCYFGEDVDDYEDGQITGHGGAWRAGVDGAIAGILMPAAVEVGQAYRQEVAAGVAEDRARHTALGEETVTPAGTYTDTLTVNEDSPLDAGATSLKVYARGVGLIFDDGAELVEIVEP